MNLIPDLPEHLEQFVIFGAVLLIAAVCVYGVAAGYDHQPYEHPMSYHRGVVAFVSLVFPACLFSLLLVDYGPTEIYRQVRDLDGPQAVMWQAFIGIVAGLHLLLSLLTFQKLASSKRKRSFSRKLANARWVTEPAAKSR